MLRVGVLVGSLRRESINLVFAKTLANLAKGKLDFNFIDLHDVPMYNEDLWERPPEAVVKLKQQVRSSDAILFVTPEYNRSIPAALKNALDFSYPEWNKKAAAVVGYGSVGGARAVEHLRTIAVELQMAPTRAGVHIQGADFFAAWQQGKDLREFAHLEPGVKAMLDELVWWTKALKTAREAETAVAKAA